MVAIFNSIVMTVAPLMKKKRNLVVALTQKLLILEF